MKENIFLYFKSVFLNLSLLIIDSAQTQIYI